ATAVRVRRLSGRLCLTAAPVVALNDGPPSRSGVAIAPLPCRSDRIRRRTARGYRQSEAGPRRQGEAAREVRRRGPADSAGGESRRSGRRRRDGEGIAGALTARGLERSRARGL